MSHLVDGYKRNFSYLRLSITNICNFHCNYCLPDGYKACAKTFLSMDEIRRLISTFAELGIQKIRLTGGEPTLRKDFVDIARLLSTFSSIKKRVFTTNGYRLESRAALYHEAGLNGINVSIDSLNEKTFFSITKHNRLNEILRGIDKAIAVGFDSIKINSVLLKGINDEELDVFLAYVQEHPVTIRFIELMQTTTNHDFFNRYHISATKLQQQLLDSGWQAKNQSIDSGPAIELMHENYQGCIGFIRPYSENFCSSCNRLRVSAYGELHLCLFGDANYSIRHLLQSDEQKEPLKQLLNKLVQNKSKSHRLKDGVSGNTPHLASIGG